MLTCKQRATLQISYSSLLFLQPLTLIWGPLWSRPFVNMNRHFNGKSLLERPYFTRLFAPLKTAPRLYETTLTGNFSFLLSPKCAYECVVRKLTGKLRDAYAPLVEGCCKAILVAISSNVDELKSGTGMLEGFPPVLLPSDFNDADTDIRSLAFLSRLTETLHTSSFDSDLGCDAISSSISKFYIFCGTEHVILMLPHQTFMAASRCYANSPSPDGEVP